jgi:hypothetical protein
MWGMAASAPGWLDDIRVIEVDAAPYLWEYRGVLRGRHNGDEWDADIVPAMHDAATLGCLMAIVREAWAPERLVVLQSDDGQWGMWIRFQPMPVRVVSAATEAEAIVAALEAAP